LLKAKEVLERTSLSRGWMYELMERGAFPRPVQIQPGSKRVAWRDRDIEDWIERRKPADV
jgi:predicted DNA-binding transcriptional regulator AlpA